MNIAGQNYKKQIRITYPKIEINLCLFYTSYNFIHISTSNFVNALIICVLNSGQIYHNFI
jgi:hypothetical protein